MTRTTVYVCGGVPVSAGLENVAVALQAGFPDARVGVLDYGAIFGEASDLSLHFRHGEVHFSTMYMVDENVHLFDGSVPGPLAEVIAFVQRISECLAAAGLEHNLHVARGPMDYAASFWYPSQT